MTILNLSTKRQLNLIFYEYKVLCMFFRILFICIMLDNVYEGKKKDTSQICKKLISNMLKIRLYQTGFASIFI